MTRRKKTDGERIADQMHHHLRHMEWALSEELVSALETSIDRLLRRRMAEAWDDGWLRSWEGKITRNPYRGRKKP